MNQLSKYAMQAAVAMISVAVFFFLSWTVSLLVAPAKINMLLGVDIAASICFAVSGAYGSIKHRNCWWLFVSALLVGAGGGTIRNAFLMQKPVWATTAPALIPLCILSGVAVFMLRLSVKDGKPDARVSFAVATLDTIAIAVTVALGSEAAKSLAGAGPHLLPSALYFSILTSVGGGLIRDLLQMKLPSCFINGDFFASAAAACTVTVASGMLASMPFRVAVALVTILGARAIFSRLKR
ncbi:trimeric intracellular cation channel family protein [Undibacterium sp. TJN25]|uniref:trimeric intracellular cation channel family protein n=1 Tax=Undibacterium sp. TJN25 TaxID=3413056 RepID=UPI003BF34448